MKLKITPLSQRSGEWASKKLDSSTVKTIGEWGCTLTCVSMVCNYFGHETNPLRLNDDLVRKNGFYNNLLVWGAITNVYSDIQVDWNEGYIDCPDYPAPLEKIRKFLDQGYPVILKVDYSPKEGLQEHWVLAVGYNEASETKELIINDPWDGSEQFFIGRIGDEAKNIYKIVVYKGKIPEIKPTVEDQIKDLESTVRSQADQLLEQGVVIGELETEVARAQKAEEEERKLKDQARSERNQAIGEKEIAEKKNEELRKQVASLEENIKVLEDSVEGLKTALAASETAKLSGISTRRLIIYLIKRLLKGGGEENDSEKNRTI